MTLERGNFEMALEVDLDFHLPSQNENGFDDASLILDTLEEGEADNPQDEVDDEVGEEENVQHNHPHRVVVQNYVVTYEGEQGERGEFGVEKRYVSGQGWGWGAVVDAAVVVDGDVADAAAVVVVAAAAGDVVVDDVVDAAVGVVVVYKKGYIYIHVYCNIKYYHELIMFLKTLGLKKNPNF